jgi:RHS repeat-associated protein
MLIDMVATATGEHAAYVYTADDERIAVLNISSNGYEGTWRLRGLDNKVIREYHEKNGASQPWSWSRDYIYRGGLLLSSYLSTSGGTEKRYDYHLDHLGTPRLITDAAGRKISAHNYYPFGAEITWTDAVAETMTFTGHERDSSATAPGPNRDYWYYMHARYDSPNLARFLSIDRARSRSSHPQDWNRYAYAANNPAQNVDRKGDYYELASAADRKFFVEAMAGGTMNKAARELVQRQAADPIHKIVLRAANIGGGTNPNAFTFGDSSRPYAPYTTINGNLYPSGITSTVDKAALALVSYPTPTITLFHELKHDDIILYQGFAAHAAYPDNVTLNVTTGQVTVNSIFEAFGRAAATTFDDPMHALTPADVDKLIADPGQGGAKPPCTMPKIPGTSGPCD